MKYARSLIFTIWLYSTAGGLYIIVNSWVHPHTLTWQLTHFAPWPREDTFGIVCLLVSFTTFYLWQLTRKSS